MADPLTIDMVGYIAIITLIGGTITYSVRGFWSITTTINSNSKNIEQLNKDIYSVRERYRELRDSYLTLNGKIEYLDRLWTMIWEK